MEKLYQQKGKSVGSLYNSSMTMMKVPMMQKHQLNMIWLHMSPHRIPMSSTRKKAEMMQTSCGMQRQLNTMYKLHLSGDVLPVDMVLGWSGKSPSPIWQ